MQVVAAVALNDISAVDLNHNKITEHAVPLGTSYLTIPVPDPPAVISQNYVPTVPVRVVFDTVSAAWATHAVNVNVLGSLVALR